MKRHILCYLATLLPVTVSALTTDQACLDDCIRDGGRKLQCLTQCSTDIPTVIRKRPLATPAPPRQANGLPETDMLGEMMAQAEAACKVGNKQACLNLKQMKAGK
ncbi:MAG: hypothetical protein EKK46_02750 [Rhodocyclaceae bacterium]|nr:MAG: hypothetical protein EKK46_02750 [Rhodocyclaceae bacterium]